MLLCFQVILLALTVFFIAFLGVLKAPVEGCSADSLENTCKEGNIGKKCTLENKIGVCQPADQNWWRPKDVFEEITGKKNITVVVEDKEKIEKMPLNKNGGTILNSVFSMFGEKKVDEENIIKQEVKITYICKRLHPIDSFTLYLISVIYNQYFEVFWIRIEPIIEWLFFQGLSETQPLQISFFFTFFTQPIFIFKLDYIIFLSFLFILFQLTYPQQTLTQMESMDPIFDNETEKGRSLENLRRSLLESEKEKLQKIHELKKWINKYNLLNKEVEKLREDLEFREEQHAQRLIQVYEVLNESENRVCVLESQLEHSFMRNINTFQSEKESKQESEFVVKN